MSVCYLFILSCLYFMFNRRKPANVEDPAADSDENGGSVEPEASAFRMALPQVRSKN